MTYDEFHSVVLKVANITSIRYWNYLNYPCKPQEFAILCADDMPDGIHKELLDMGFEFGEDGLYRIGKTESSIQAAERSVARLELLVRCNHA